MNSFVNVSGLKYKIFEVIGKKENTVTYRAADPQFLRDMVAVRCIRLSAGESGTTDEFVFRKKMKNLAGVKNQGVPQIIDFSVEDGWACIVMSWLDGEKLSSIRTGSLPPLSLRQSVKMILQTAEILKFLHNNKPEILHLNLKPEHIIIGSDGKPQLAGISLNLPESALNPEIARNPGFKAPEQITSSVSVRTDIYSLCCLAFYIFTGIEPDEFAPFCIPSLKKYTPYIPDIVAALVEKGLSYEPANRYGDMDELIADLNRCLDLIPAGKDSESEVICPFCGKSGKQPDAVCKSCGLDTGVFLGGHEPQAYFDRGVHLYEHGSIKLAERYFYQAYRLDYPEPDVLTYIAMCTYKTGFLESAENMLRNILNNYPDNPAAIAASAQILFDSGMKSAAIEMLQWGGNINQPHIELVLKAAEFQLAVDEPLKALNTLVKYGENFYREKRFCELKTKALKLSGRKDELLYYLRDLPPSERTSETALIYGKILEDEGKIEESLRLFQEAHAKAPHNPHITLILAENYSKMGAYGEAASFCIEALREAAGDAEAVRKAVRYLHMADKQECALPFLFYLEKIGQLKKEDMLLLGTTLVKNNFPDSGIKYLEKYTKLAAKDPEGWKILEKARKMKASDGNTVPAAGCAENWQQEN